MPRIRSLKALAQRLGHTIGSMPRAARAQTGFCYYRADGRVGVPYGAPRACAVGELIADEHYSQDIEAKTADTPEVRAALRPTLGRLVDSEAARALLTAAQEFHDSDTLDWSAPGFQLELSQFVRRLEQSWPVDHPLGRLNGGLIALAEAFVAAFNDAKSNPKPAE